MNMKRILVFSLVLFILCGFAFAGGDKDKPSGVAGDNLEKSLALD